MSYFTEPQKTPQLLSASVLEVFIRMMLSNASPSEVEDFLYEAGFNLTSLFPVKTKDSMAQLQLEINGLLSELNLGSASVVDSKDRLLITHRQIPKAADPKFQDVYIHYFSTLLCGLYNGWFRQTGAPASLMCRISAIRTPDEIVLTLRNRVVTRK